MTYTQRDWDRTVGWGKVPKEYKKESDTMHVDPDKRPWTYDCDGNKIVKTEDGEPDYTKRWNEDEQSREIPSYENEYATGRVAKEPI